jgi:hypothetical protein
MALIKKRDVEKYFADRRTKRRVQKRLASVPDATASSGSPANTDVLKPTTLKTDSDHNVDQTGTGHV